MGHKKRIGQIMIGLTAAILSMCTVAGAGEAPKLRYIEEHTNTQDVRDIALFENKIWTATGGGISVHDRQDGRFLFKLTSIHGLFGNSVNRLKKTARGTLLAAGDFGVAEISKDCADASTACFISVSAASPTFFDPVLDIVEDKESLFLLGHQSGLRKIDEKQKVPLPEDAGMWRAAAKGTNGILIGGMDGRVLWKVDTADAQRKILHLDKPILDISAVQNGFLLASGFSLLMLENNRVRPVLDGSRAVAASSLSEGDHATLAGTSQGDIFEFRNGSLKPVGKVDGRITALLADGGTIWLSIAKKGLFRFNRRTRTQSEALGQKGEICSNHVTRITRFHDDLIAGTFDNGACAFRGRAWEMLSGLDSQYVHGVASDGAHLWAATSNGLVRYDENLVPVPIGDNDPKEIRWFAASAVTALTEEPSGIAIGSPWGVVRATRKGDVLTAKFVSHFQGAPEHLTAVAAAPNGLFISSESAGVRFVGKNRKSTRSYLDPVHLPEAWVLDVSKAGQSGFWAATCQSGVAFVKQEKAVIINASKGLADNRTVSIAAFNSGAFVATLSGLSYAFEDGTAESPIAAPLPDPRGSMAAVDGNTLYFGTEFGLAVFQIAR